MEISVFFKPDRAKKKEKNNSAAKRPNFFLPGFYLFFAVTPAAKRPNFFLPLFIYFLP